MEAIFKCTFVTVLLWAHFSPMLSKTVTSYMSIKYVGNKTFSSITSHQAIWSRIGCLSLCSPDPSCDGISFNKTQELCNTFSGISQLNGSGFFASSSGSQWEMMHITSIERLLVNNGYQKYSDGRWVKYYPNADNLPGVSLTWPAALSLCQQPFSNAIMFVPRNLNDVKFLANITELQQKSWGASSTWSGLVFDPSYMTAGAMPPVWMDGTTFNDYASSIIKTGSGSHPQIGNQYGIIKYNNGVLLIDFFSDSRPAYVCQVIPPLI